MLRRVTSRARGPATPPKPLLVAAQRWWRQLTAVVRGHSSGPPPSQAPAAGQEGVGVPYLE